MKRILVLNFFPAFTPPASGGELRYFHLYNNLSNFFDITLLSPTYSDHKEECIEHSASFREYRVPKETIHHELHVKLDEQNVCSEVSALVCALSASTPNRYHQYYLRLYQKCDIVVHESPYMLGYDLFWGCDQKPRIYNSYNHESKLVSQLWDGQNATEYIELIASLEGRLVQETDLVFAISEEERLDFIKTYNTNSEKIKLAPNGINPGELQSREIITNEKQLSALFVGSGHPPNIEAVNFILSKIAPFCPDIIFHIAGTCCESFLENRADNVRLLGRVDDEERKHLFETSQIAINPMFSGAGTNLKILEFLSAGIPTVSTFVGARGLDLVSNEDCILVEPKQFAEAVLKLARDEKLRSLLSQKGKEKINRNYSWQSIAQDMTNVLNSLPQQKSRRKVLVLNDFSASKPSGGGEIRLNRIYSGVAKDYKVCLLCLNNNNLIESTVIDKNFTQISIPKTPAHIKKEKKLNDSYHISANDILTSQMVDKNELFVHMAKCASSFADIIALEHPYMSSIVEHCQERPVIYHSYNFELGLKETILKGHPKYDSLIKDTRVAEERACQRSNTIICVSQNDVDSLEKEYGNDDRKNQHVIENGADGRPLGTYPLVSELLFSYFVAVFIGSAHKPNIDSLDFIVDSLASQLPNMLFAVIGSVAETRLKPVPANVLLFGRLEDEEKNILLESADVGINPMFEGSGSNLKMADYFASGLPVVTTPIGARGFQIENGTHAIISSPKEFASALSRLKSDSELRSIMGHNAYKFILNHLDWRVLSKRFRYILDNEVQAVQNVKRKKRLLIITYRYTKKPLGGAEMYLQKLISGLQAIGEIDVDVATLDVFNIVNCNHFAADYQPCPAEELYASLGDANIFRFNVEQVSIAEQLKGASRLNELWLREFYEVAIQFVNKYEFPLLMGGWYYPEHLNTGRAVWSGEDAAIYIGDYEALEIEFYVPQKKQLTVVLGNGEILFNNKVKGDVSLALDTKDTQWVSFKINKSSEGDDPRPMGLYLKRAVASSSGKEFELNFDNDYRSFLKSKYNSSYIAALIDTAENRNPEFDSLFQKLRGPNSKELEDWLDDRLPEYDMVLGHSIPFATSCIAARYAKKHGKILFQLPHFHADDGFYHWKSYYNAMRSADAVFASPPGSISTFFSKIGTNTIEVPGGGIDPQEYVDVSTESFNNVCLLPHDVPIILVLGRKAGAKNYQWVIDAVDGLNKNGQCCQLVVIGRDEDGVAISEDKAIYLGEQPRKVVLGALKSCRCLVNMSSSESFGIVLLESWMLSRPVIVNSDCAAFMELIQDGENGFAADKNNLKDKIKKIVSDADLADKLGQHGHQNMGAHFSWRGIAAKINSAFMQISNQD